MLYYLLALIWFDEKKSHILIYKQINLIQCTIYVVFFISIDSTQMKSHIHRDTHWLFSKCFVHFMNALHIDIIAFLRSPLPQHESCFHQYYKISVVVRRTIIIIMKHYIQYSYSEYAELTSNLRDTCAPLCTYLLHTHWLFIWHDNEPIKECRCRLLCAKVGVSCARSNACIHILWV